MRGYNPFFGTWVRWDDEIILIDVGPAKTAKRLIDSLNSIGLDKIDYILLTHIHIDHSGALAEILDRYPMAKAICHEKALKYLVEPSTLWMGSLKVLGNIAGAYGKPQPVSEKKLVPHTEINLNDLIIIETPGHAAHHLSFIYGGHLYVGEAAGNHFNVNGMEYLRPATPPRFFFDVFVNSIDRLLSFDDQPICYAHVGGGDSSHRLLSQFKAQLKLWNETIHERMEEKAGGDDELVKNCMNVLLQKDPNLAAFDRMDPDTQRRERTFIANAIRGFVEFFREGP